MRSSSVETIRQGEEPGRAFDEVSGAAPRARAADGLLSLDLDCTKPFTALWPGRRRAEGTDKRRDGLTETTMFEHLQKRSGKHLVFRSFPPLAISFGVASFFFKFHSFALECLAFLALWFVLELGWHALVGKDEARTAPSSPKE
jgi:hypothetical protein